MNIDLSKLTQMGYLIDIETREDTGEPTIVRVIPDPMLPPPKAVSDFIATMAEQRSLTDMEADILADNVSSALVRIHLNRAIS